MLGEEIHRSGPLEESELCVPLEFLQATATGVALACVDTFRLLCWRRRSFDVCARRAGACSNWGGGSSSCAREALWLEASCC